MDLCICKQQYAVTSGGAIFCANDDCTIEVVGMLFDKQETPLFQLKNQINNVIDFHKAFGAPIAEEPTFIPNDRFVLRNRLMDEENDEYLAACQENDLVEIADSLGDMLYILCGTIIEHGMQHKITEIFNEIQASNMSKIGRDGKVLLRGDGKILKSTLYFKPNIAKILDL